MFLSDVMPPVFKASKFSEEIKKHLGHAKSEKKVSKFLESRGIILKGTRLLILRENHVVIFVSSLMKIDLPLMTSISTPLFRNVWIQLGLTTAASATEAPIQKKIYG